MVAVGMWIRLGILETPVFQRVLDENRVARAPTLEVIRRQPKEIILTRCCGWPNNRPATSSTLRFHLRTTVLGPRGSAAERAVVSTALGFMWVTVAGWLSDVIGRRQMYIIGCVFVAIFTFAYFAMLDRGDLDLVLPSRCRSSRS
jgi:hypothetical protein